jgi:Uncharacterized alpha/beta hydrolase domain (DUF2235)
MLLTDYHRARNQKNMAEHGFPLYAERWFPGIHSNIGGGYQQHGLSDRALQWMAARAEENGLKVKNLAEVQFSLDRPFAPDPTEKIGNSQTWVYRLATALLVKAPSLLGLRSVYPKEDQPLAKHIRWTGGYVRPIGAQEDVSAVLEKMRDDSGYPPKFSPVQPVSTSDQQAKK